MAELYPFQKDSVDQLLNGRHIIVAGTGMGKTAIAMAWAEEECKKYNKSKVLVVTTASKCRAKNIDGIDDFSADAKIFCSTPFFNSLSSSLTLISWHKLKAWTSANIDSIKDYVVIFDEVQKSGAGTSSGMGKSFLRITGKIDTWAGFTATPGDTWLKFYPYFEACNFITCKTHFLRKYAIVQTYKGYPEIVKWLYEDELQKMWSSISYSPDATKAMRELPKETYKTVTFDLPKSYKGVLKTRMRAGSDGSMDDFLDTPGALVAELRRICFTKDKQEWVSEFIEGLESGAVVFYNYVATGDKLEELISKALPRSAKVWRIDGKHHDIPTAETIGERDIVLCQWQSGSEALNLQFLHYWVAVELCYSYSTFIQGIGRIKRIGQKYPMSFYLLICGKGIEQDVLNILRAKGEFSVKNWCISNNIEVKEEE